MRKHYYLHKRKNGRYYVRFVDKATGRVGTAVSTGEKSKSKAEIKAFEMFEQRNTPENPVERLVALIEKKDLKKNELEAILNALKSKGHIISAVLPESYCSQRFVDFCLEFWDFDTSPYVKEKQLYRHTIHRTYCIRNIGLIKKHFVFFKNLTVSDINRQKIKGFQLFLMNQNLSTETINQTTRIATTALKWAFYNGRTQNDCFTGLRFCAVTHKPRKIIDLDTASKLFSMRWNSEYSKLANLVAMCTGMRAGEIQALRRCDIGEDRIYVRHNYVSKNGEGLKECKNGEPREIPISVELRNLLLKQVFQNPYNEGDEAFVFWGLKQGQPMDAKPWRTSLRRVLKELGYEKPEEICFHSWRHFYTSLMAELTPERKLKKATGHKTLAMLQHYADHIKPEDFELIRENESILFSEIIKAM